RYALLLGAQVGALRALRVAEARRRRPAQLRCRRTDRPQALLAHFQRRRLRAVERYIEQRHAGLLDEATEDGERIRTASGRLTDCADEVLGSGGVVRVTLEECLHALAEAIRTEPSLEHGEHGRALVVGNAVEGRPDLAF